jgi:prepilin-type N-terminal cleavage/methylation domain-containing protein
MKKGFTLIELLITVAVLAAIAVVSGINLFNYYSRQNLELTTEEFIALIRDVQNRSLTQQDGNADGQGDQWGIHFENSATDLVRLFCCGPSYASGTIVSAHDLRIGVQLTDPSEGNSKDIIFSRLTGYPNTSTSITVAPKGAPSVSYTITVSAIGQVTRSPLE